MHGEEMELGGWGERGSKHNGAQLIIHPTTLGDLFCMNDGIDLHGIDPPVYEVATAVFCNVKHYRRHWFEFK